MNNFHHFWWYNFHFEATCFSTVSLCSGRPGCCVHGPWTGNVSSMFLPWHRLYVVQMEAALGEPIPYWDWTVGPPAVPDFWTSGPLHASIEGGSRCGGLPTTTRQADINISLGILGDEVEAVYVELTRAILTLLRQTRSSDEKVVEKAEIILDAFHLKTEFGIKTRETDFDGTSTISLGNRSTSAPTILANFISDQIGRLRSDPDLIATTYNRLKRLCDLIR